MKVNVNSWHYKMICNLNARPSKSLCLYFWQAFWAVFFLCILLPVIGIGALTFLVGFVPIPLGDFILWLSGSNVNIEGLNSYLLRLGIGYLGIILVVVFWILCAYWKQKRSEKVVSKRPDSILTSYIKAKKSKICPIIEFTNGGEE